MNLKQVREPFVVEQLETQASSTPLAVAIKSKDEILSYQHVAEKIAVISSHLKTRGHKAGDLIGICMHRSSFLIAALYGILKAGCAFVPLDPSYPRKRLEDISNDANLAAIVCDSFNQELSDSLGTSYCVDLIFEQWECQTDPLLIDEYFPPSLPAYAVYTSGSTGKPKGVLMHRGAVTNLISAQKETHSSFEQSLTTLQYTSINFDVSYQEIFSTLSVGGTLVLVSESERKDFRKLLNLVADNEVERIFMPFAVLEGFIEIALLFKIFLPKLNVIVTAGEQLKITSGIKTFCVQNSIEAIINQYGPSETHLVTSHILSDDPELWPALPPIGRAVNGVKTLVLDNAMTPADIGELYIGGAQVALGYLNDPDQTSKSFISCPVADSDGEIYYRSGDIVRSIGHQTYEFVGRRDDQIKIAGVRIEIGEIEYALASIDKVKKAVAYIDTKHSGKPQIKAYVEVCEYSAESSEVLASELKSELKTILPTPFIPTQLLCVERIPQTINGKLDRKSITENDDSQLKFAEIEDK